MLNPKVEQTLKNTNVRSCYKRNIATLWFLFGLCFLGNHLVAAAQDITPVPYDSVLNVLLRQYYPELDQDEYLAISRQPDGYYVGVQQSTSTFSKRQYPFLIEGEGTFRKLPFRERGATDLSAHYGTLTAGNWRAAQFDRHLYFGFPGFTSASIATLSAKKNRSDQETQQLARAYAEHAMNLLSNQYGTSDPDLRFSLDEATYEYLSPEQLEEYLYNQLRAIKHYGELPYGFETPVGNASTKQANEWLTGYVTLLQYNSQEVAENFIGQMPDTYGEHLKFAGKLLLESVPENGILITESDNDTYPLLYLQLKENLRTDVLVVNRHLLNVPRYVNMLRKGKQVGGALKLSTDDELVRSWSGRSFMPGDRYELYTASEVLDVLTDLAAYTSADVIPTLPFGGMQLSKKVDGPLFRPEARPLRMGNLVTMDLIATNFKDGRQVAVSTAINQDYFAYANSWQQLGLVYNLGDEKPNYAIDLEGTVAWSAWMFQRTPIRSYGKQSRFLLDQMERIIVKSSNVIRLGGQHDVAFSLVNRYLSHLDYKAIFARRQSIELLEEMHALGYDPVSITAYASYLRDVIVDTSGEEMSRGAYHDLRKLSYYIAHGEWE
ncbi:hypothetical protein CEQ90_00010 [Lewinellaceae bacterium SD302]|nr:hypothetical protein CEQ90_00010 [Lewinellaceae bacterium SD302]